MCGILLTRLSSLSLAFPIEGAYCQGFLNRYLQAAPHLEFAYNIQQGIGVFS